MCAFKDVYTTNLKVVSLGGREMRRRWTISTLHVLLVGILTMIIHDFCSESIEKNRDKSGS